MRLVFMGTPAFAVPSLEALLASGHEVVGVCTQPDRPKGRGQTVAESPVKTLAVAKGIPVAQPTKMHAPEFRQQVSGWRPDVIAVTAFGRILPKAILDLPPGGCVNVHASLLPAYRGAAPIQWALMRGESETGITTMVMDEGMDTGAVLLQRTVSIAPEDTAAELGARLATVGGALLVETLTQLDAHSIVPQKQDDARATLAPLLTKEDGAIPWTQSAVEIVNRIRGCSPWPGSYTFHRRHRLIVWKARVDAQGGSAGRDRRQPGVILAVGPTSFLVGAGEDGVEVLDVQPANKKRMAVEQFLQGHALRVGERLTPQPQEDAASHERRSSENVGLRSAHDPEPRHRK